MRRRFGHWLIRRVGYEALLMADRRELHTHAASALESQSFPEGASSTEDLKAVIGEGRWSGTARGEAADEVARHWELAGDVARAGRLTLVACTEAWERGRFQAARSLAERAAGLLATAHDDWGRARAEQERANVLRRSGQFDDAAVANEKALVAYRGLGDERGVAEGLIGMGWIHAYRGEFESAKAELAESLGMFRSSGDPRGEAISLYGLGAALENLGEFEPALERYRESLAIHRRHTDLRGVANALFGIGHVHMNRGDAAPALEGLEEALSNYRRVGDDRGVASALEAIGMVHSDRDEYGPALEALQQAESGFRRIGDAAGLASALYESGSVQSCAGDTVSAQSAFDESLAIYLRIGNARGQANVLIGTGGLLMERGELKSALDATDRAVDAAAGSGHEDIRSEALAVRSRIFLRQGDPARARSDAEAARVVAGEYVVGRVAARVALALCTGDPGVAQAAADDARARGHRYLEADSLLALAELRLAKVEIASAVTAATEAGEIARAHGMKRLLARAVELQRRGTPPTA